MDIFVDGKFFKSGMPAILTVGNPAKRISVGGKIFLFEMHSYCGPMPITKDGSGRKHVPDSFWRAVTFWAQQGQRVGEDGLCVWDRVTKRQPITKHMGGRHYLVTGWTPEKREKGF